MIGKERLIWLFLPVICRVILYSPFQLEQLTKLKSEESSLVAELEAQKINDPAEIRRVENQAQINKTAADRWTDNIWAIKKFLTKKKGLSGKEVCD